MTYSSPPPLPRQMTLMPRRRRRWVSWLLALFIFCAGMICGAGLVTAVAIHRLQFAIHHPDEAPDRVTALLRRRLSLTQRQAAEIRAAVAHHQRELQDLRRQVWPQVQDQLNGLHHDIDRALDPTQQAQFDHLFRDLSDDWLPPPAPPAAPAPPTRPAAPKHPTAPMPPAPPTSQE